MQVGLLGPLVVVGDEGAELRVPGAAKERAVLAVLALRAPKTVSVSELIYALWGEHPPRTAEKTLRTHVSGLRRRLPAGVIETVVGGYRLVVAADDVDVAMFEILLRKSSDALAANDGRAAAPLALEALGLWRGEPLGDLGEESWGVAEITRLVELRHSCEEQLTDARLALGEHGTLIGDLEAAVAAEPLRERRWAQLMLALYRAGRQADALRAYQRLRKVLAEELGLEPGEDTRALEAAILAQDAALSLAGETDVSAAAAGPRLPSGTVTFLFSDIEGSTRRLGEVGAARYADELMIHRVVIRQAAAVNSGVEIGTEGDSFFVAFARASDALAAADQIRKGLAGGPVQVRIGVHSGETLIVDDDYVGLDVHRAARICSAAHGGQVLVSRSTRDLAHADLRDLGEYRLKDLTAPERLFQLGDDEFPPLRALGRGNLPIQPDALLGRQTELADLLQLTRDHRLVTITGAGGSGKTRLALQVAAELADDYPDGAWWVPLAAISDPTLVVATIGQAVGAGGSDLGEYLSGRNLLILVDNLEQVLDSAAQLADLLASAPGLSVLATSRERLAVAGEHEYPVPPLDLAAASELFVTRARQVKPDFTPDEVVQDICVRLDGLPLAIELASARVKVMTTRQILARLDRRFELLTGSRRDAPRRLQTMRAAIDWSNDLLSEGERRLFRGLGVFSGSFALEAAIAICRASLDELQSLVEKSLLRATGDERFYLLETTRDYALERLGQAGETDELRRRHADWFLGLATDGLALNQSAGPPVARLAPRGQEAHPFLDRPDESDWLVRLDLDSENLDAAMVCLASDPTRSSDALRMGIALRPYWNARGLWKHGAQLVQQALDTSTDQEPAALRAAGLYTAGVLFAVGGGEMLRARADIEDGIHLAREGSEASLLANLLATDSFVRAKRGDYVGARTAADEAVTVARTSGDPYCLAYALSESGAARSFSSDPREKADRRALVQEALELYQAAGSNTMIRMTHLNLGVIDAELDDLEEAQRHFSAALIEDPSSGSQPFNPELVTSARLNLAVVSLRRGDIGCASDLLHQNLTSGALAKGIMPYHILTCALCASASGEDERAALLHGAADESLDRIGEVWDALEADLRNADHARLRKALGTSAFDALHRRGRELSPEHVQLETREALESVATTIGCESSESGQSQRDDRRRRKM